MKVLLTGGSGFIAAHCVDYLLRGDHSVVFTVRSHEKGRKILSNHPSASTEQLSYVIVGDIAKEDAFDEAVKSDPPFEAVLHTASPFHFNIKDRKKDLLDPAIIGTTGILRAIKKSAPTVKRVVITSSFASIINPSNHAKVYNEDNWNSVTMEEALSNDPTAYRASKKFAEKAAWDFMEKEKPDFTLATICPPLVLGPIVSYFNDLSSINTSNEIGRDMIQGKYREKGLPPNGVVLWVDVRDLALAHVRAMERSEAANKRFFVTAGFFRNSEIADIIKKNFPDLASELPESYKKDPEDNPYDIDNSRAIHVLEMQYRSLDESITDLVKSLQAAGA